MSDGARRLAETMYALYVEYCATHYRPAHPFLTGAEQTVAKTIYLLAGMVDSVLHSLAKDGKA